MSKNVDLTSKEWRDIVFEGKNKDFGAYQLRKNSDKRHNLAVLFTLLLIVVIAIAVTCLNVYNDYRAELEKEAKERAEKMAAAELLAEEQEQEDEPEQEEQKFEQEIPEVPQEVLATVQVTQIAIVDADKVKNEIMTQDEQKEDNTARGVVNQEGSNDADKFEAVKEQVIVKEEPKEEEKPKPKEDEIFVAVEQQAQFPGGPSALNKWLSNHINYPASAAENDIQGRVIVKFVVEKDGKVGTAEIVKGVDRDLDKEALRVVKSMPKWQPAKNNGVVVRSWFTLPVTFKLQN
jgi:protein TonB